MDALGISIKYSDFIGSMISRGNCCVVDCEEPIPYRIETVSFGIIHVNLEDLSTLDLYGYVAALLEISGMTMFCQIKCSATNSKGFLPRRPRSMAKKKKKQNRSYHPHKNKRNRYLKLSTTPSIDIHFNYPSESIISLLLGPCLLTAMTISVHPPLACKMLYLQTKQLFALYIRPISGAWRQQETMLKPCRASCLVKYSSQLELSYHQT